LAIAHCITCRAIRIIYRQGRGHHGVSVGAIVAASLTVNAYIAFTVIAVIVSRQKVTSAIGSTSCPDSTVRIHPAVRPIRRRRGASVAPDPGPWCSCLRGEVIWSLAQTARRPHGDCSDMVFTPAVVDPRPPMVEMWGWSGGTRLRPDHIPSGSSGREFFVGQAADIAAISARTR
jgi:hypothetical protein